MRVCMIAEGCYPYVVGGVSSWIHSIIKSFPQVEFVVLAIVSRRSQSGKFAYELPDNLTEVYEAYLEDLDWGHKRKSGRRTQLNREEYRALRSILLDEDVDWDTIFTMFQKKRFSVDDLLMGADFLNIVKECYQRRYPLIVFSDFLWTMRSIYMPLFLILQTPLPRADIYHCVATGYAGVLGSMAKHFYRSGLLVSEHGIYTREREEELLKASWVEGIYKNVWIDQFRKMSRLAYERADKVTSLYEHARQLQLGLGCAEEKTRVTPNGIDMKRFADIPGRLPEDEGYINVGAVLRVAPIKDVKTMIRAFAFAKEQNPALKLWIMGPVDEEKEYAEECFQLVEAMHVKDVIFTGRINVADYLGRMDFTILTSVSEGQPLTILEGYAAKKPVIATDVGNCRGLIYGEGDDLGPAGILTHIMNVEEITAAIRELAQSSRLRRTMGECGYARLKQRYQLEQMIETYRELYISIGWEYGKLWPEEADGGYGGGTADYGKDVPAAGAETDYGKEASAAVGTEADYGKEASAAVGAEADYGKELPADDCGRHLLEAGAVASIVTYGYGRKEPEAGVTAGKETADSRRKASGSGVAAGKETAESGRKASEPGVAAGTEAAGDADGFRKDAPADPAWKEFGAESPAADGYDRESQADDYDIEVPDADDFDMGGV